jgi:AcrR family transcriptional regulator
MTVGSDAIVDETCKLLAKLPPGKVTRAMVARAAGVDPSLIRYYFKNRSLLLLAAFKKLTDEYSGFLEEESAKYDATPRGQLCARVSALFRLNTTYPYYHDLIIEEIATMEEQEARDFLAELQRDRVGSYRAIVEAGIADGSFRDVDVNLLFMSIVGMCHFFTKGERILRQLQGGANVDDSTREAYHDLVCDVLLNGVAGSS